VTVILFGPLSSSQRRTRSDGIATSKTESSSCTTVTLLNGLMMSQSAFSIQLKTFAIMVFLSTYHPVMSITSRSI